MRNMVLFMLSLGVAAYFIYSFHEKGLVSNLGDYVPSGQAVTYRYPAAMELESEDGRALAVTLTGRNESHIQFLRDLDGEAFVYPINQLKPSSIKKVMKYPDSGLRDAGAYMQQVGVSLNDVYREQLREEIRRIDEEIARLFDKSTRSNSTVERRTIQRTVETLQEERGDLESKVAARAAFRN